MVHPVLAALETTCVPSSGYFKVAGRVDAGLWRLLLFAFVCVLSALADARHSPRETLSECVSRRPQSDTWLSRSVRFRAAKCRVSGFAPRNAKCPVSHVRNAKCEMRNVWRNAKCLAHARTGCMPPNVYTVVATHSLPVLIVHRYLWCAKSDASHFAGTSAEHPEAPPCDLDGLLDVASQVRFSAAGKALPRYLDRLYTFYLTVVASARG